VSLPAGTHYYGCVVAYDTFGKIALNLPTTVFSGITNYGIASGNVSAPNGFNLVPIVETDLNGFNQCYIKMAWNPNPEINIEAYDVRLLVTGYNTRYYSTPDTQTSLYVPFPPGLSITGVIRAINNQGLSSPPTTGFVTTPIISQTIGGGGSATMPVGGVFIWPSTGSLPTASGIVYLNCDGSYQLTTAYPALFSALGYSEGQSGVSGSYFKLPSGVWNDTTRLLIRAV
jgi:hypothetical protein